MTDPTRRRLAPALIGVLVVAGLAAGGVAWWRSMRPVAPAVPPRLEVPAPAPLGPADTALAGRGDVIERAMRGAAPGDSTAMRNRYADEVKGVDVTMLAPPDLATFVAFANAERCTCGCGFTLAACRSYDPSCETSLPLAISLRDSIVAAASKRPFRGR
jgi:hypothetical protein